MDLSTLIARGESIDVKRVLESWRFKLPMTVSRPRALTVVRGERSHD